MPDNNNNLFPESLAKIISVVFHPLLMPLYGMGILFTAPTFLGYLPLQVKKIMLLVVLMNNVMLPVALLPFLRNRNIISSYIMDERGERIIPLIVISILYSITAFIFYRFPVPDFFKSFVYASAIVAVILTIINFWFKISIHGAGVGAVTALIVVLSIKTYTPLTWYLTATIIAVGLILSSRLRLNVHNPLQVWAGFITGLTCSAIVIWLL
jgi:hypothetical protein